MSFSRLGPTGWLVVGLAWLVLSAGLPLLLGDNPGLLVVRQTIFLTLGFYLAAMLFLLAAPADMWPQARACWTVAWIAYIAHVIAAFQFVHHWSHEHAVEHTRQSSGFGPGIFVSYTFTLWWTLDVAAWWLVPSWYARRPVWVRLFTHIFIAFMFFNGTVVFESGFARWVGVGLFAILGGLVIRRLTNPKR